MIKTSLNKVLMVLAVLLIIQPLALAKTLEFAQVADVHYSFENSQLDKYLYFLSLSLKKKSPEFVIFLGDNVDKSKEEDVIGFMRAIHSIREPYYIVLGKNDAHGFSGVPKEDYLDIVSTFNRNQDDNKNYYYFKPNSDIICVILDDSSDFAQSTHGEIPDEQLKWLENLLIKYPKRLFLIFHHTPLVPPRVEYKYSMNNSENYQNLLKKYNNILLISSGQYHQESVQKDDRGVRHISAPAFKNTPHSYQLIKIDYNENSYKSPSDVGITVTNIKV